MYWNDSANLAQWPQVPLPSNPEVPGSRPLRSTICSQCSVPAEGGQTLREKGPGHTGPAHRATDPVPSPGRAVREGNACCGSSAAATTDESSRNNTEHPARARWPWIRVSTAAEQTVGIDWPAVPATRTGRPTS
jgi:hypothetical protein